MDPKKYKDLVRLSALGLEMGLSVVVCIWFGGWLDKKLDTTPWMFFLFIVLGFIAAFRPVISLVRDRKRNER